MWKPGDALDPRVAHASAGKLRGPLPLRPPARFGVGREWGTDRLASGLAPCPAKRCEAGGGRAPSCHHFLDHSFGQLGGAIFAAAEGDFKGIADVYQVLDLGDLQPLISEYILVEVTKTLQELEVGTLRRLLLTRRDFGLGDVDLHFGGRHQHREAVVVDLHRG